MTTYTYDGNGNLLTATLPDPDGTANPLQPPQTVYTYDPLGRLRTETDARQHQTTYQYDPLGRLSKLIAPDPDGTAGLLEAPETTYTYDAAGNLKTVTDALGRPTTYEYDELGRPTSVTYGSAASGSAVQIIDNGDAGFSTAGNWTFLADQGYQADIRYSAKGSGADKATWTFSGLAAGTYRVSATWNTHTNRATDAPYTVLDGSTALGTVRVNQELAPDDFNDAGAAWENLGEFTISGGALVVQLADNANEYVIADAIRIERLDPPPTTRWSYDGLGNLLTETDPLGNVTKFDYDAMGRLAKVTGPDPDGTAEPLEPPLTTYSYDAAGNLKTVTDPLGRLTTYEYDALGRQTAVTHGPAAGGGSAVQIIDDGDAGFSTSGAWTYRAGEGYQGDIRHSTKGSGADKAFWTFDGLASGTYRVAATWSTHSNRATDSPYTITILDGTTALGTVDVNQELAPNDFSDAGASWEILGSFEITGGKLTVELSDAADEYVIADAIRIERLDPTYTTQYDAAGNVWIETDALGHKTTHQYDNLGRLTSTTDARNGVTSFTYDPVGNLKALTDPVGNTTTWIYDNLYRLTSETNELDLTRTYAYDPVGNLTKLTDRNGRVREFVYDGLDRRTQEKWLSGTSVVNTIDYAYDAADQLTSAADAKSSYSYTYDALGRTRTVDNSGTLGVPNVVLTATYDAAGNRTGLDATVGGTADFSNRYSYDALGRTTRITQADGSPSLGYAISEKRVDLAYNAAGQYDAITRYADLAGTQLVATSTHGYDAIGRLTSLSHKQSAIDLASYTWEYDAHSRLTKVTSPDGTTTYSYDTTDQLTGADHSDQTDEAYSYDLNGNRTNTGYQTDTNNRLVSDGTYNYAYDSEGNRTRKTTIATGEYVEYAWDHRNRLTAVTYKTSTSTVTKKVEYDYDVFDRRIAKRVDETLGTAGFDREYRYVYDGEDIVLVYDGTGSLENRYLHGPGIDEVFADENALGEILWALTDNQGTVRDWAKSDGTIANHVTYDAFGEITGQTSATHEPLYAYTGREWDADAGMYYYRARWYDAAVGRFVSEDPIGFEADDPNLSRYVLNSPTNSVDPSGLILDRLRRLRDIVMDLPSQWRGLTATQRGLLLDAAQLGLDVGGIFEPTPFCDGANAAISLFRRDWMGAGLSGLGIIPYVGDLGKAGKIPRYVDRVQEALRMARGNPAFARVLQPILENLSGILGEVPLDRLPDSACRPLQNLQRQIDDYLEAAERLRRKLAALEDAQRGAVRSRSLPDGRIRYYGPERPARRPGPTRGASFVTEWDPRTGRVRQWMESYDQIGRVNRVHPKMIDGQVIDSPHYPPTGSESGR